MESIRNIIKEMGGKPETLKTKTFPNLKERGGRKEYMSRSASETSTLYTRYPVKLTSN